MPVYNYRCLSCEEEFELLRPISQMDLESECPDCTETTVHKRLVSMPASPIFGQGLAKADATSKMTRDKDIRSELKEKYHVHDFAGNSSEISKVIKSQGTKVKDDMQKTIATNRAADKKKNDAIRKKMHGEAVKEAKQKLDRK